MDEARECWIIGRALYEAVAHLERLSEERRPESDIEDMRGRCQGKANRPAQPHKR